ncbi:MAG: hypothetical protein ACLFR0_05115 [Alphaproteobacteria bacterium]
MSISLDTNLPPIFAEANGNPNAWMMNIHQENEAGTAPIKEGPINYADLTA